MPRIGFAIDNRACIGCHACTVACKAEHLVPLGVNRTWVKYIEKGEFPQTRRHFSVQRCNHCEDAPCVEICPVTSLFARPDGIVDFDSDRCIGCKACMQACPYDALYLDPQTQTAAKCNYCTHRVDAGFEPACVVVCPVEAIVSGDLDDPDSRIAQLDRAQKVQYPKVEKGTQPKLFYVGGETAAVDPAAAPPGREYVWSGNDGRIDERALRAADEEAEGEARARRVYDPLSKPRPWGWMVSAYISTKAVASGVVMAGFGLFALGRLSAAVTTQIMIISIVFLMLTGALLVGDLKQPRRFLYVLLRPQWKSWLVRGAYVIAAFGVMLPVAWIAGLAGASWSAQAWLGGVLAVLAALAAMYTGFLLAQARGRDYWQSPLLPVVMLVDALAAGLAVLALTGTLPEAEAGGGSASLLAVVVSLIVLTSVEFLTRHQTRNAERTARLILRGPYAGWFWGGVVAVGLLAPLVILLLSGPEAAACVLILAGIGAKNHVLVQAPQDVPLS
ncbi:MAG: polysulfide reductase NrfD [Phycisphaerae bacterium]|nr:polysulfide reductase NrfD [Phycisphaerae bacterium]